MDKKTMMVIAIVALVAIIGIMYISLNNTSEESAQDTENTEPETLQANEEETVEETPEENTTEETPQESGPQTHTVEMLDFEFSPEDIIIKQGDTVIWVNKGKGPHYVLTSSGLRILDSKNIKPGESWSYTFEEIGFHKYFSPIYTRMGGTVSVQQ